MSTVLVSGAELTEQDVAKGTADWLTRSLVPSPFLEHEPRTMLADIPSATKPLFRSIPRRISRGKSLTSFRSKPMRLSSHAASLPRPRVPPSQITGAASTQDLGIELDATEASLPTRLPACLLALFGGTPAQKGGLARGGGPARKSRRQDPAIGQ